MSKLHEGLTENSLEFLIKSTLSVDEYESKISNNRAIVVGFFVLDEEPARDLSRFIDRSGYDVLDTEISPHPTEEGDFVCWVEFKRDEKFPEILCNLVKEVENLCKLTKWKFKCPKHSQKIPLSIENIKKYCLLNPEKILNPIPDDLMEQDKFWKHANVQHVYTTQKTVIFENLGQKLFFRNKPYNKNLAIDPGNTQAMRLQNMLGPAYSVYATSDGFIVESENQHRFISPTS